MGFVYIRKMVFDDLFRGLNETLSALRETHLTASDALHLFRERKRGIQTFVAVAANGQVVGTASLLIEPKLLGGPRYAGRVEDVAVRSGWQGKGVGRALMNTVIRAAKQAGCYKVTLDCREELMPFYRAFGFVESERHMVAPLCSAPKPPR